MKNQHKYLGILILAVCMQTFCLGQNFIDDDLTNLFEPAKPLKQDYTAQVKNAANDISTIVSVAFLFYKSFISSQDNPSCVFTPSCSVYAIQSIQKSGFVVGWLKTFDRLSRCHGLVGHHDYPFDTEKNRYYDPVQ